MENYETYETTLVPRYADYPEQTIERTEENLDQYGRWLASLIRSWNPASESVGALREILAEARVVVAAINEITNTGSDVARFGIDISNLPSAPIPEGIDTTYPIWSMDARGWILTGRTADEIGTIVDVIGAQEEVLFHSEIEWLRAHWMQEHGYSKYSDRAFLLYDAPELTAEEIKETPFDELATLLEFVEERSPEEVLRQIRG